MLSHTAEDYLETIYLLNIKNGRVKSTDIAKEFGIKTPSVISALKSLRKKGYLKYESYGYVELSEKGLRKAKEIYERHKVVFRLLHFVLGVEDETASRDTCGLEHYISDETFDSIKKFFQFIKQQELKGNDIVSDFHEFKKNIVLIDNTDNNEKLLSKGKAGKTYRVIELTGNPDIKRKMLDMGIIPGEKVTIKSRGINGFPVELNVQGYTLSLRKDEIESIKAEEL